MVNHCLKIYFSQQELWLLKEKFIWWPATSSLIVSDLHLGKGISFIHQNLYLPPYDIQETLNKLKFFIDKFQSQKVICLGDSFHRPDSYLGFDQKERDFLNSIIISVPEWCWIYGNHDHVLPPDLKGKKLPFIKEKTIEFHHAVSHTTEKTAAIIGHYHPKYTLNFKKTMVRKPCYAWNKNILIMPSFGSYTGGLDIYHSSITNILGQNFSVAIADTDPNPLQFYINIGPDKIV